MAPTIDSLTIADEPDDWREAGFCADDDGGCRIGFVRVVLSGPPRPAPAGERPRTGLVGWSIRDPVDADDLRDLDGIPTTISNRPPSEPAEHPNGTLHLDHLVLSSGDGGRTQETLETVGWDLRRVRDVPSARTPTQQRFFRAGEVILELVAPTEPTAEERLRPARLYGLALVSADLDATVASYRGTCSPAKEAVQPGRRIATLRTRELGISVPIAFMTPPT